MCTTGVNLAEGVCLVIESKAAVTACIALHMILRSCCMHMSCASRQACKVIDYTSDQVPAWHAQVSRAEIVVLQATLFDAMKFLSYFQPLLKLPRLLTRCASHGHQVVIYCEVL